MIVSFCVSTLFIICSISQFLDLDVAVAVTVQPRPLAPNKDLAVYGYGSVHWRDRMEDWKKKQGEKLQVVKHEGHDGGNFGDDLDDSDLPMYGSESTHWFPLILYFMLLLHGWM